LLSAGAWRAAGRRPPRDQRHRLCDPHGLQWKDPPKGYGPYKTLYNRFIRWSRLGVFDRIFASLAGHGPKPERIMIDSTHLKAQRTAASLSLPSQNREPVRQTQGLAAHRHPLRPMRPYLLLGHLHRRCRRLLS
jgi:transposase